MISNDQVILSDILEQKKSEIAPGEPDSVFFEVYVSEQILKDYDLSWEEIRTGIIGGGGDGGIDSLYTFVNGILVQEDTDLSQFRGEVHIELYAIQSKQTNSFREDPVRKLRSTAEDVLDLSKNLSKLKTVYSENLLLKIDIFRKTIKKFASNMSKFSIKFYYATIGTEVNDNVKRLEEPLRETILKLYSNADFMFEFLNAEKLLKLVRRQRITSYELSYSEAIPGEGGYICLVPLKEYYKFITDDKNKIKKSIFDANVRDYQGDVQVNQGIRETLLQPLGEDFWWLNNGITIIASEVISIGKTLTLKNPQVVNGMQTSKEIVNYFSRIYNISEDRCILIRTIIPKSEDSHERIIRATNSQTSIPLPSLKATDPIHRDIEDYFKSRNLFYERRKNFYKNEGKSVDSIISIPYLAQSMMAILLGRPDDARARPSTLLKKDEDYSKVFSMKNPISAYEKAVRIQKICETFLKKLKPTLRNRDINNLKYFLSFVASRLSVKKIVISADELANIDLDTFNEPLFKLATIIVWQEYNKLGADDTAAKSKELTRNITASLKLD